MYKRQPYIHNLFQNGAATLAGVVEAFRQRRKRGELPDEEITFVMVSGDGGIDVYKRQGRSRRYRQTHPSFLQAAE